MLRIRDTKLFNKIQKMYKDATDDEIISVIIKAGYVDVINFACGENKLSKLGFVVITGGRKLQRYKCNVCGRTFTRNGEGEQ